MTRQYLISGSIIEARHLRQKVIMKFVDENWNSSFIYHAGIYNHLSDLLKCPRANFSFFDPPDAPLHVLEKLRLLASPHGKSIYKALLLRQEK